MGTTVAALTIANGLSLLAINMMRASQEYTQLVMKAKMENRDVTPAELEVLRLNNEALTKEVLDLLK